MLHRVWIVCSVFMLPLQVESLHREPAKVRLEFGGKSHQVDDQGFLLRPEMVKMQVCADDISCSECPDPSSCWHGHGQGPLKLEVPASSPYKRFVAEVWASCSSGGGRWSSTVYPNHLRNGVLNLYVNDELFKTVKSPVTERKHAVLPIVADSRVRVEFVRRDTKMDAFGQLMLLANNVDAYVDNCMGVKNCLADLGDGTKDAFLFRNSNVKQLQCISSTTTMQQDAVSQHCRPWVTCLSKEPGRKDELKILLQAGVGKHADPGQVLTKIGRMSGRRRKDHPQCIDPAVEDAESWDCECMAKMTESCGGADEACFRKMFCAHDKVCSAWKDKSCESRFSLIAEPNASIKESALLVRRVVTADGIADTRLDGTLEGKCNV